MSYSRIRQSATLVFLGLFLVLLANLGLTVHSGHHSLGAPQPGSTTRSVAGHSEPDPSLHLDSLSEVRTLTCPGCLLQHQVSGSYFCGLRSIDRTAVPAGHVYTSLDRPVRQFTITRLTRGPPPVDQI